MAYSLAVCFFGVIFSYLLPFTEFEKILSRNLSGALAGSNGLGEGMGQ